MLVTYKLCMQLIFFLYNTLLNYHIKIWIKYIKKNKIAIILKIIIDYVHILITVC